MLQLLCCLEHIITVINADALFKSLAVFLRSVSSDSHGNPLPKNPSDRKKKFTLFTSLRKVPENVCADVIYIIRFIKIYDSIYWIELLSFLRLVLWYFELVLEFRKKIKEQIFDSK